MKSMNPDPKQPRASKKDTSAPKDILAARARKLARRVSYDSRAGDVLTVVEFRMAHETYAIELNRIRVIHPLKTLTVIPGVPDFIRGIINLRGEIVSVVDLKVFFDLPHDGLTRLSQVIILSSGEMEFGILTDEILGISEIPKNAVQASLATLTGIRADYLKGVTGDGRVVLDEAKLLSDEKMRITI
jgi:purine-binding chemotaxis protein CheW